MLAYRTLEEAEEALGRAVSLGEKLWFNYSANKPDFVLHCHNTLFLLLFYSLLPLPYLFIELFWSNDLVDKYKIQPKIKRSFLDMFNCYKAVMWTFFVAVGPIQLLSSPMYKLTLWPWLYSLELQWLGIRTGLPLPGGSEIFCQLLVYFIVEDFSHYWLHRMLHFKWAYKKIHHVHHEYTAPFGLSAPYAHWAEVLILGFGSFLGPAIVPCHMITYWLWFIVRQMEAIETHSGYDFPWSPRKYIPFYGGAEYHDYHHYVGEKSQSNFASVFTYCDYIYGTDKGYRHHKQTLLKRGTQYGVAH